MKNDEFRKEAIDLKRLGLYFSKKIWIVLLMVVIGGAIGALSYQVVKSVNMPVEYQAVSKLYIKFGQDSTGQVYQYYNGYTWNELLDADPILNCIMGYIPTYDKEKVAKATDAKILSDVRLLTVTINGEDEKFVREVQQAVESGLAGYATISDELVGITTIKSVPPTRIYWVDRTSESLVLGAVILGLITLIICIFRFIIDEGIYVQSDITKRYDEKALGVMPRNQKGLQPYLNELKANVLYSIGDRKCLFAIDIDNHADLRAQDFERLLNWEEGGSLSGLEGSSGELVWHVNDQDEFDDLLNIEKEKEWTITVLNEGTVNSENLESIRKAKGAILLVPFGVSGATRKLERIISLFKTQGIEIHGIVITEADEQYLNRYYS
ncbi:MAG: hypothetical protein MJZ11_05885 [Lachnospiraceae bacterium]|nr:hypothetical protein [Lachnospiraceae bacterium]